MEKTLGETPNFHMTSVHEGEVSKFSTSSGFVNMVYTGLLSRPPCTTSASLLFQVRGG
jgi:hypothetical protein